MKKRNPKLKTLIAVGGWNLRSEPFVASSNSPEARSKFCTTAKQFILKYKFDGLDFDWEYPAQRGGTPEDKANFAALVEVRLRSLLLETQMNHQNIIDGEDSTYCTL